MHILRRVSVKEEQNKTARPRLDKVIVAKIYGSVFPTLMVHCLISSINYVHSHNTQGVNQRFNRDRNCNHQFPVTGCAAILCLTVIQMSDMSEIMFLLFLLRILLRICIVLKCCKSRDRKIHWTTELQQPSSGVSQTTHTFFMQGHCNLSLKLGSEKGSLGKTQHDVGNRSCLVQLNYSMWNVIICTKLWRITPSLFSLNSVLFSYFL